MQLAHYKVAYNNLTNELEAKEKELKELKETKSRRSKNMRRNNNMALEISVKR